MKGKITLTPLCRLASASIKTAVQLISRSGVVSATAVEIDNKHITDRTQYIPHNIVFVWPILMARLQYDVYSRLCVSMCMRTSVCVCPLVRLCLECVYLKIWCGLCVCMCACVVRVNAFSTHESTNKNNETRSTSLLL